MNSSTQGNLITDEERKYFVMTPRLVGAICASPFEVALWTTIKDISGETGECYISTPDLALLANMSDGSVSKYRLSLIKKDLLSGEIRKDAGYPQPVWHLRIPDLWPANIRFVTDHPTIADRIAFKRLQKKSLHEVKAQIGQGREHSPDERGTPPDERGTPPDETKKKEKKKKEKKNPPSAPKQAEKFNTYLSGELRQDGNPKTAYQMRSEELEVWFVRCRLGEGWESVPVERLVDFLPDWRKGASGLMKTWRSPVNEIFKKCNEDLETAKIAILICTERQRNLTYSKPVQIMETFRGKVLVEIVTGKIKIADYLPGIEDEDEQGEDDLREFPEMITPEKLAEIQGAKYD